MYATMTAHQHSGANFNESMIWFVCALDVPAMRYTCSNALWCAAKIKAVVQFLVPDGTI